MDLMKFSARAPFDIVRSRHLLTMRLEVSPIVTLGETPNGLRRIGYVTGGEFAGERLKGRVLAGGNDWQIVRPDGSITLDVRLALETEAGAVVTMSYRGVRHGPPEVMEAINAGRDVDPTSYYFRIGPMFEAADPSLAWLNGLVGVGVGHRTLEGPVYVVHEIL